MDKDTVEWKIKSQSLGLRQARNQNFAKGGLEIKIFC